MRWGGGYMLGSQKTCAARIGEPAQYLMGSCKAFEAPPTPYGCPCSAHPHLMDALVVRRVARAVAHPVDGAEHGGRRLGEEAARLGDDAHAAVGRELGVQRAVDRARRLAEDDVAGLIKVAGEAAANVQQLLRRGLGFGIGV